MYKVYVMEYGNRTKDSFPQRFSAVKEAKDFAKKEFDPARHDYLEIRNDSGKVITTVGL